MEDHEYLMGWEHGTLSDEAIKQIIVRELRAAQLIAFNEIYPEKERGRWVKYAGKVSVRQCPKHPYENINIFDNYGNCVICTGQV